ncbi:MAG: epoxide hydrolase family protein [Gemmatimonas sp.]
MNQSATFQLRVDPGALAALHDRLANTRWAEYDAGAQWDAGPSAEYLRKLVSYWQNGYDWQRAESAINALPQFTATVSGVPVHYVHVRSEGTDAMPLVLLHGFPDTYLQFQALIPMLAQPANHGGDTRDTFDIIVPSIPGYPFTERSAASGDIYAAGDLIHTLVTESLGYAKYAVHGSGVGAYVCEQMARDHRDSVIGIHLTEVPRWHEMSLPDDLTSEEVAFMERLRLRMEHEDSGLRLQSTRPQTLVDAVYDSPVGLAAWVLDAFESLDNSNGDFENRFSMDDLLTTIMLYWLTDSIGTAILPDAEIAGAGRARWMKERAKTWIGASNVPAAFTLLPEYARTPPRHWAERFFRVERWSELPEGGFFAARQHPAELAKEIREFLRPFRVQRAIPVL